MTNYEAIKAMDEHELAEFMESIMQCCDCPVNDCGLHESGCTAAIIGWLNEKSDDDGDDDTIVAHSDGKTINISHAHVVIID